jgi:hypothetical protein
MTRASYLEAAPDEVLRHIAFLSAVSSIVRPPHALMQMLLTSRRMYNSLSIHASPEVYANLFCAAFDTSAITRRFPSMSSSNIASELVRRHQVLNRIRHQRIAASRTPSDLWTAYLMMLENDGLNRLQLAEAGVVPFVLDIIRKCHGNNLWDPMSIDQRHEVKSLSLWLLWLTASGRK